MEHMINHQREPFCRNVISFLRDRITKQKQTREEEPKSFVILSPESIQVFLEALKNSSRYVV